jgi:hypothetical protein
MKLHSLTVLVDPLDDDAVEALYARCDDASAGQSCGSAYVGFDREAASLEDAIQSALADLKAVGIQPRRIELDIPATVP